MSRMGDRGHRARMARYQQNAAQNSRNAVIPKRKGGGGEWLGDLRQTNFPTRRPLRVDKDTLPEIPESPDSEAREELPVKAFEQEIRKRVRENNVLIIVAETGAGKTTEVGPMLEKDGLSVDHLQPRRLAASASASWVSLQRGELLGETVGFQHAMESRVSEETQLRFATDGYYLAKLLGRGKSDSDVLIIDEFHEKNPNMEIMLALWKKLDKHGLAPKLVIMSATLSVEPLKAVLPEANVIDIPGRTFPVEAREPAENAIETFKEVVNEGKNLLVFLPGKREISAMESRLFAAGVDAEVIPLHSKLSREEQEAAFKDYLRPKIVLATDIAQTSLTISGIDVVADFGLKRALIMNKGVPTLTLMPISKYDSEQRKGRAGRVKPGEYIYLGKTPWEKLPEESIAPIQRAPLGTHILRLKSAGIDIDSPEMEYLNPPCPENLSFDYQLLEDLGLMSEQGNLTARGEQLTSELRLPVSERQGTMILEALDREHLDPGILERVIDIVAIDQAEGLVHSGNNYEQRTRWKRLAIHETAEKKLRSDHLAQREAFCNILELDAERPEKFGIDSVSLKRALAYRAVIRDRMGLDPEELPKPELLNAKQRHLTLECIWKAHVDCAFKRVKHEGKHYYRAPQFDGLREMGQDSVATGGSFVVGQPFDMAEIGKDGDADPRRYLFMVSEIDEGWYRDNSPSKGKSKRSKKSKKEEKSFGKNREQEYKNRGRKKRNNRYPTPKRIGRGRTIG